MTSKNTRQHPEETEIHSQTGPARPLPRTSKAKRTSAACRQRTGGPRACDASVLNQVRERRKVYCLDFSIPAFAFTSLPLNFSWYEHPCLVLIAREAPRGAKHNPMSPHALLHMFKVKGGSLNPEGNCQAVRSQNKLNEIVLLFCPVKIIILYIQKLCRQQWKVEEERYGFKKVSGFPGSGYHQPS